MNEWKFQCRRRKRGQHCLIQYTGGVCGGRLCGCGSRTPPSKGKKTRIVKRTLARQLQKELSDG